MNTILHITTQQSWDRAKAEGQYSHESLQSEGFIHCSKESQIIKVANRFYKGRRDLILLLIQIDRVVNEIRWENSEGGAELFPHIYGTLNADAVIDTKAFPPNKEGTFDSLP